MRRRKQEGQPLCQIHARESAVVDIEPDEQVFDLILYYYQGLRMWSRIILFDEQVAERYVRTVKQLLLKG